jgi:putative hydrolase of the HAD superfamily
LKIHHPEIDIEDYLQFVHNVWSECVVEPDPVLRDLLSSLAAQGWELWLFTNGSRQHAIHVLSAQGTLDVFGDRIWDCNDQWLSSSPEVHNKPERFAYEGFESKVGRTATDTMVMIEDSAINLRAPADLGWKCVWISYGTELSWTGDLTPAVINSVHDLANALE